MWTLGMLSTPETKRSIAFCCSGLGYSDPEITGFALTVCDFLFDEGRGLLVLL